MPSLFKISLTLTTLLFLQACNQSDLKTKAPNDSPDETIEQEMNWKAVENAILDNDEPPRAIGRRNQAAFIVGGEEASIGDFPWQVYVSMSNRRGSWICGGIILDENNIVTAAHCGYDDIGTAFKPTQVFIRYGGVKLSRMKRMDVEAIIIESRYIPNRPDRLEHDIAILQLEKPMRLTPGKAEAVTLPLQNAEELVDKTELIVSGFGTTSDGGNATNHLRYVQVDYITKQRCLAESDYGSRLKPDMICAGFMSGGKDSCSGDSGGPLVDYDQRKLIGIVSWGWGCAAQNRPGVYTDVTQYVDWINRNKK